MNGIRVLLADDQPDVRSGFRLVLDSQPDITVVGEATDGTTALILARRLRPDVVLTDIRMPGIDGLELTRLFTREGLRVVVVTTFDIVYGSFIVLVVGLTIALPVYAWSRFGTAVRGTVARLPPGA